MVQEMPKQRNTQKQCGHKYSGKTKPSAKSLSSLSGRMRARGRRWSRDFYLHAHAHSGDNWHALLREKRCVGNSTVLIAITSMHVCHVVFYSTQVYSTLFMFAANCCYLQVTSVQYCLQHLAWIISELLDLARFCSFCTFCPIWSFSTCAITKTIAHFMCE